MRSSLRCVLLVCACALALQGVPPRVAAAEPFSIYVIQSLTGPGQFIGNAQTAGLHALEQYVNEHGGIRGRPVRFVVEDDQSNPQIAVQLTNELLAKHLSVILGTSNTAGCRAMFPLVKDGPVLYCLSPAVEPVPGTYQFSVDPDTPTMLVVGMRYFRMRGWTRIAELSTNDASGQNFDRSVDDALALPENKGVTLVAREHFAPADISVQAQLARIKAADPQVLIVATSGSPVGTALRGIAELGLSIPIATSNASATFAMMGQYAKVLPKEFYFFSVLCLAPEAVTDPSVKAAIRTYLTALAAAGVRPDGIPSNTWDSGSIVISAFRKLGTSATPAQIRDYIDNLRGFAGAMGTYDFKAHPGRGLGQENVLVVRWDAAKGAWVAVSKPRGIPL